MYLFCGEGSRLLSRMCPASGGCTLTMLFEEESSGPKSCAGFFYRENIKYIWNTSVQCAACQVRSGSMCLPSLLYTYFTLTGIAQTHKRTKTASFSFPKVNTLKDTTECGQQCGWKKESNKEKREASSAYHLQPTKRARPRFGGGERWRMKGDVRLNKCMEELRTK